MNFVPQPAQVVLLWKLITTQGEAWKSDIQPVHLTEKKLRDDLVRHGFISEEKRKRERKGRRASTSGIYLRLEEKGWEWIANHMTATLSRSRATADVLEFVLRSLSQHLARHGFALADFMAEQNKISGAGFQPAAGEESWQAGSLPHNIIFNVSTVEEQIAAAYSVLTDQRSNVRVRLADLRNALSDIPNEQFDNAVRNMLRTGEVVLNRLDNPREIAPEDEAAKILTALGDPRHILHMEIPAYVQ